METVTSNKILHKDEYTAWQAMKRRCSPKNISMNKYYSDRGIAVCDRWERSFVNFLEDLGRKPSKNHTLDRIDNDKGYSPGNCRWATRTEQALNRRVHNLNSSGIVGVCFDKRIGKWVARMKSNGKSTHIGSFTDISDAIEARRLAEKDRGNYA